MSKNIRRMLCGTLMLGALSFIGTSLPGNNIFMTEADAYTVSVQKGEIKTMTVKTIEGEELDFVDDFENLEVVDYDGNNKEFYVVMPDDSEGIKISFSIKQDEDKDDDDHKYVGRIFKSASDTASAFESGDEIDIDGAGQTIYVRIYKNEDAFKDARKDGELSQCRETYKIHVKREGADIEDLNKSKDSSAVVSTGQTVVLPHIDTNLTVDTSVVKNQWVQKGNFWVRYDENGEVLRNAWFQDSNGKWYYLQSNGYMTTGWRYIDGKYYCFDKSGAMVTGWVQDEEGDWYYLQSNGEMAKNTTIDGYKIAINGKYVK